MSLQTINEGVEQCKLCPLHASMPITPVKSEYGKIEDRVVIFVMGAPSDRNAFLTEVLSDSDRWSFFRSLKEWDIPWYLTFARKCSGPIRVNTFKKCNGWINEELGELPENKLVIAFGQHTQRFVSTPHIFSSWGRTFNNGKSLKRLTNIITDWKDSV